MARKSKVMGAAELSKRLKAIPEEVRKASYDAALRAGERIAQDMRALAPVSKDGSHGKPPGTLRDSITVTEGGKKPPSYSQGGAGAIPENAVAVTAGNSGARYAHLVEFGTSRAEAQPYFLPAWRSNRGRARRSINAAIGRAIRKAR